MTENSQLIQLIQVMLDRTAYEGDREDAALQLARLSDTKAIPTLSRVALDTTESDVMRDSAAEAIARIWVQNDVFDGALYDSLQGIAKDVAITIIRNDKPEWLERYNLQ